MADSKQILAMLTKYMRVVADYSEKSGEQKKEFVINSIKEMIDSPEVLELLSFVIDYFIDIEKGRIVINKKAVKRFMCC